MGVYARRNRADAAPKRAAEPQAEFFERVAGPFWDQVRDVINEWWSRLPDQAQPGLLSRLRDRNSDTNVYSALWELYLHQMLLGSGCNVEVERQTGTGGYRPDFLVTRGNEQFVVEAIWKAQKRDARSCSLPPQLSDAIDRLPSPNFFLSCELRSAGTATPPQRRLKAGLTRWLESLDPDQVIADHERKELLPSLTWQEAGWCLTFQAIPRSPGKRGNPSSRTIGVYPAAWATEDGSERVLHAVTHKGGKYGDLELPFIVALGHAADFPEDEDIERALYGSTVEYAYNSGSTFSRKPDGYWTATYDHAHSRVSGVLVVNNPAPWTWTKSTPVLWQSPDPASPPAPIFPTWATAQLAGIQVERQPGFARSTPPSVCQNAGRPVTPSAGVTRDDGSATVSLDSGTPVR